MGQRSRDFVINHSANLYLAHGLRYERNVGLCGAFGAPSEDVVPAPKRFNAEAKDDWASAPETVRAEVLRMERELTAGLEKHRATILELRNEIAELKSSVADVDSTTATIMKFAADHPRFEELSEDICFFLDTGRANDLVEAYELAERFNLASRSN
jgi:hypothetical protein